MLLNKRLAFHQIASKQDAGWGQTHPCQRSQICVNSALSAMTKKINSNRAERDG